MHPGQGPGEGGAVRDGLRRVDRPALLGLGPEDGGDDLGLQRIRAEVAQGEGAVLGEGGGEPWAGVDAFEREDVAPDEVVGAAAGLAVEEGDAERIGDAHAVFGLRPERGDARRRDATGESAPVAAGEAGLRQQGQGALGVGAAEAGDATCPGRAGVLHRRVGEEGERGGRGARGGVVGVGEVEGLLGVGVAVAVGVGLGVVVGAVEMGLGPGEAFGGEGDVPRDGAVGLAGAMARPVLGHPDAGDDAPLFGKRVRRGQDEAVAHAAEHGVGVEGEDAPDRGVDRLGGPGEGGGGGGHREDSRAADAEVEDAALRVGERPAADGGVLGGNHVRPVVDGPRAGGEGGGGDDLAGGEGEGLADGGGGGEEGA